MFVISIITHDKENIYKIFIAEKHLDTFHFSIMGIIPSVISQYFEVQFSLCGPFVSHVSSFPQNSEFIEQLI